MEYPYIAAKNHITKVLTSVLKTMQYPHNISLEIPPKDMGDFSFPCYSLCKISKCSPQDTAEKIKDKIETDEIIRNKIMILLFTIFFLNLIIIHLSKDIIFSYFKILYFLVFHFS